MSGHAPNLGLGNLSSHLDLQYALPSTDDPASRFHLLDQNLHESLKINTDFSPPPQTTLHVLQNGEVIDMKLFLKEKDAECVKAFAKMNEQKDFLIAHGVEKVVEAGLSAAGVPPVAALGLEYQMRHQIEAVTQVAQDALTLQVPGCDSSGHATGYDAFRGQLFFPDPKTE